MKYIKTYEKRNRPEVLFRIGDHVTPIKSSGTDPEFELIEGTIYTITRIYANNKDKNIDFQSSKNPYHVCDVQFDNGRISKLWYLKRFRSAEAEYNALKFNI